MQAVNSWDWHAMLHTQDSKLKCHSLTSNLKSLQRREGYKQFQAFNWVFD